MAGKKMIEVHGVRQAIRDLRKVEDSIEDGVIKDFKKHGKAMVKILKAEVPKKSGKLKRSIKSVVYLDFGKPIKLHVWITRTAFYGYFMEYGTSKQAARPFFFRTTGAYAPEIKISLKAMINDRIDRSNLETKKRRAEILSKMGL